MLQKIANHFRLVFRLLRDKRVKLWLKIGLLGIPVIYGIIPFGIEIPDFVPVVGLIDDIFVAAICSWIFVHSAPRAVINEHNAMINGTVSSDTHQGMDLESFRHPQEIHDLGIGFVIVLAAMLITGYSGGLLLALSLGGAWAAVAAQRKQLMSNAILCTENQVPEVYAKLQDAKRNLPAVDIQIFVSQNPTMNAYTFGMNEPYTIVLTSALVNSLEPDELHGVIGHEIGHILFHHVSLINIISRSIIGFEKFFFLKWSRSSEYSADRISLVSTANNPNPLVSALIKMGSGITNQKINIEAFLQQDDPETKIAGSDFEWLSTHPYIRNRILSLLRAANSMETQFTNPDSPTLKSDAIPS